MQQKTTLETVEHSSICVPWKRPISSRDDLLALANRIRKHVLLMTGRARSSHIGSNFSIAELLAVLYGLILNVDQSRPDWPERDRFILSKGHACAAVYAALVETGFLAASWLDEFYVNGGRLYGHITSHGVPGVEASMGSLGQGLSVAAGLALAAKRDNLQHRVYVLLGDGECDEGAVWEAALFIPHHKLDNVTVIVDYNQIQSLGAVRDVLNIEPLPEKWRAFGWYVAEMDGHAVTEISDKLSTVRVPGMPTCLIAHTVKGKGVDFMEGDLFWHYQSPIDEWFERAWEQL